MVNNIASLGGSFVNPLQQTAQSQSVAGLNGNDPDGDGDVHQVGRGRGDSADISGPGRLFSQLQQLQATDPTKFKDLVANIATQLLTAASQTAGNQSQFLTDLAKSFQTAASTGNVASLQPHRHAHHAHSTYNQQGQIVPTSNPVPQTAPAEPDLKQLFQSLSDQVANVLGS